MAIHPQIALYEALQGALDAVTDADGRVYAEFIPDGVVRPYLLYRVATGTERNFNLRLQDPVYLVDVKAVAADWASAAALAQQARGLLDEQGEQDGAGLQGGADWHILRATVEGEIKMQYMVGTLTIFEMGFQLRVIMEERHA